jgi:hypothetical protein
MRNESFIWIAIVLLTVGLGGCRSVSPAASAPPEIPPHSFSSLSPAETESARKLYIAKCARCHKFYDPAKYSDNEWRMWMDKMSRKAKLKADQTELLSKYLELYRGGSTTNAP